MLSFISEQVYWASTPSRALLQGPLVCSVQTFIDKVGEPSNLLCCASVTCPLISRVAGIEGTANCWNRAHSIKGGRAAAPCSILPSTVSLYLFFFKKCLLSTCYIPATLLVIGLHHWTKQSRIPAPVELTLVGHERVQWPGGNHVATDIRIHGTRLSSRSWPFH